MNIIQGLLLITGMAFAISMLVATIIWLLSLFNSSSDENNTHHPKSSIFNMLKSETKYFSRFQRLYRTYWTNSNAPTNELITFYHEQ